MTKKRHINKWIAWLLTFSLAVTMLPAFTAFAAVSEVDDFTIAPTDGTTVLREGTDYSFASGKLTVKTATPVTIGLKSDVAKTKNTIVIDTKNGDAAVTFQDVSIETQQDNAITFSGSGKATLIFSGVNSMTAAKAGIRSGSAAVRITSENAGTLAFSDVQNAVWMTAKKPIEIDGNIIFTVERCSGHAVYNSGSSTLTVSGSPVIHIDTEKYALAGYGVLISGGTLTIKNKSGFAIWSGGGNEVKLSGSADLSIPSAQCGIQTASGSVTITDNAQLKMYDVVDGEKTAAIGRNAITCGELLTEKNAKIDIITKQVGISANQRSSKLSGNTKLNIAVDDNTSSTREGFTFKNELNICDQAEVYINILNGAVKGFNCFNGTLRMSDSAVVTVNGATTGVYSDLAMSGNTSLKVSNDLCYRNGAIYGDTVMEAPAKLELSTLKISPLNKYTLKPAAGKSYLVKAGATEESASVEYYTEETKKQAKTAWRYFYTEPATVMPVSITGTNQEHTYDGNTYDVSKMFQIDSNAGEATYSIVDQTGNDVGAGTISGKELTITKAGKIKVKVQTAANGAYLPGEATAVLTVKKGAPLSVTFPSAKEMIYGDTLGDCVLLGGTGNGTFAWKNATVIPTVSNEGFAVVFTLNDADVCDYSGVLLEQLVAVSVKPRPVNIKWELPASLIYDGTDKTVTPSVLNKVPGDDISLTVTGVLTAKDRGEYSAAVTGIDNENYTLTGGTNLTTTYTIEAKTLSADNVTAIADVTYTGADIEPAVEVKDGDNVLTLGTDYTVAYESNRNAGIAKAIITFGGNYQGTAQKEFTILPKTIQAEIGLTAPVKKKAPQTEVETDEYKATVVWSPDASAGFGFNTVYTATVTIVPKENYTVKGIAENGYLFADEQTVENAADSDTVTVTYPATAKKSNGGTSRYTVRFQTNGGSTVANQSVTKNSVMREPAAPEKEGFDFAGWYTDRELKTKYDFSEKVTKSFTLYAAWTEKDLSARQIILTIGENTAKVFGKTKSNDVAPKIVNDRTMLPARFVAENLGADVSWNDEKQLVTIQGKHLQTGEAVTILITIDSDIAYVNGKRIKLDSPAFLENDRTYTPIRFISEQLGASVEWEEQAQKVIITKP